MKNVFYVLSLLLISSHQLHAKTHDIDDSSAQQASEILEKETRSNAQQQQQQQDDENTGPQVLQQFGGVVMSFLTLLQNPNNSDHALTQVGNMVQGMINIGKITTRRNDAHSLEEKLTLFFETEDGQAFLHHWQSLLNVEPV